MISAIERNTTNPAADTLQMLARALDVEVWQLQIEGIDSELLFTSTLPDLVHRFSNLSRDDRHALESLVDRLAKSTNRFDR